MFGLLKQNNNDQKVLPTKLSVTLTTQYINANDQTLSDKIVLIGNDFNSMFMEKFGFSGMYKQFISKELPKSVEQYGYYINDQKIIMIWIDFLTGNGNIDVISAGKILNEQDIKEIVKYIIKTSMNVVKAYVPQNTINDC